MVGRLIAVALNFITHVLIVRYLAQSDYGALAYAASAVSIGSSIAVFGMNKTLARFAPIYEERGDYDRLYGSLALALGIMLAISLSLVLLFYGLNAIFGNFFVGSEQALAILLILILAVPIQTMDSALLGLCAIFASPSLIFWRRHIVSPLLHLAVAGVLIWRGLDVFFLAAATVAVGALGLSLYAVVLYRLLRQRGFFAHLWGTRLRLPVREMLGFSLPLLSTDVVFMLRSTGLIVLLGALAGAEQVALFSAVVAIAAQNMLVIDSFRLLFMPAAARLYAHNDASGINDLYWQTAVWVAIFSFPMLLVSLSLAQPLTVFLFGDEYQESAMVLAILAIGYYVNAAFGFNGLILRVFGRVRYLVTVDLLTAIAGLAASALLIPMLGAVGAAMGATLIFITQNLLYQLGLGGANVARFATRYLRVYLEIPLAAVLLLMLQWLVNPPLYAGLVLAAIISFAFTFANRRFLRVGTMFPELRRLPLARILLG